VSRPLFAAAAMAALGAVLSVVTVTPAHADASPSPSGSVDTSTLLEPTSDSALLNLLGQQGVEYVPVTVGAEARDAGSSDSTLVIDQDEQPGPAVLTELKDAGYGRVIILSNDSDAFDVFMPNVSVGPDTVRASTPLSPSCPQTDALAAGDILMSGTSATFTINATDGSAMGCYAVTGFPTLAYSGNASSDVVALGSGTFYENDELASAGNAALALRLFGAHKRLVWFAESFDPDPSLQNCSGNGCDSGQNFPGPMPTTTITLGGGNGGSTGGGGGGSGGDGGGGSGASRPTLTSLMPSWIWWALLQLLVAVLLVAYWRGRRLGAVVTEKLPVTVRAAETVEGHARLYRRANAHGRAAELLRKATASRLAGFFGVPAARAHADPSILVAPVAARLNVTEDVVADLLAGQAPQSEAELVLLADHLDQLEQEVRSS
jgi:hypothetical protein